jgi:serine/threonine protein kinase/Tol biopolymer transport system component
MSESFDRQQRVRALFEELRERPAADQTAALAAACAGDFTLYQEVARLLAADARAGSFLERGAIRALPDMSTLIGTRIGSYEIRAAIGAGGMGHVYRAHDMKLHREVALKILPDVFAADPDRLARFQREAQLLASLNHPHIAAIYGLEEVDVSKSSGQAGVRALVLELVEGPTLADRIVDGPIPLDEAVRIARQMVDALEAAHAQGIIHRDLKPANVKVRPDGSVKVLDFGLAKALDSAPVGSEPPAPPTITSPAMTRMGVILGTAAYMSPEQAKGRPADKRSDIWSFGCVLFEMLTGRLAFSSDDVSGTLAFILTREPSWNLLPPETPPSLRRLLGRCLEKDRARRLADIADARLELDESITEGAAAGGAPAPQPQTRATLPRWLPWSIAAVSLAITLLIGGIAVVERSAVDTPVYRSSILVPGRLGGPRVIGTVVALSPDGRRLAFVATDATGQSQLWMRALDAPRAQPLADTVDALSPFWSPDSGWLAFVQNGKLKKMSAAGGPAVTLCDSARIGGSWNREDVILFTQTSGALARVPASGGTPAPLATIDANGEVVYGLPVFLPDGQHFVYQALAAINPDLTRSGGSSQVYVGALASTIRTPLPLDPGVVQYARGFLWFMRGSTLMAQPFDVSGNALAGEAVPVAEQVRRDAAAQQNGFFSVSATGALVFQSDSSPGSSLVWYDRQGRPTGTLGGPADYADVRLSPDGRRALVSVPESGAANRDLSRDLWIFDEPRSTGRRFTFNDMRPRRGAIWSPDGSHIVFATERKGHLVLVQKASSGAGSEDVLLDDKFEKEAVSWSPDGTFIMYHTRTGAPRPWVLPLGGDRKPFAFSQPRAFWPQFSPDGRWVAYMSTESGRNEVYVAPFSGAGGKAQISPAGGQDPMWRGDGRELLYLDARNNVLMSAAVTLERDRADVGEVKPLFKLAKVGARITYGVSPDGQRILAVTENAEAAAGPLTLVVNWPALLKK